MRNFESASVPLSILDRANARFEQDEQNEHDKPATGTQAAAQQVLHDVVVRAQAAEQLGYHRFWVAEHHAVPGILGSAPTVLMSSVAARTRSIRIGSGGVMVPDHQPLVSAEQIATLQALYPDRIDIGLGSSVGFTAPVRRALRQADSARFDFPDDVGELIAYLDGRHVDGALVTAEPADESRTPLFVLASSRSIPLAAQLGTGLVVGGPGLLAAGLAAEPGQSHQDIAAYRRDFQPSPRRAQQPRVIISLNVAVADTAEAARALVLPEAWALTRSRTVGSFDPLHPAHQLDPSSLSERERRRLDQNMNNSLFGTADQVVDQLRRIVAFTGADEVLITGGMADPEAARRSDELLSRAWHS